MSRTGNRSASEADPCIPVPFTDTQTACQIRPEWFSHEQTSTRAAEKDIAKAKDACSGCPIVKDCLKWALAHPDLTQVGVWAATTTRQRGQLRRRLESRLGPDWVGVLAQREQAARRRTSLPRDTAAIERERAFARLELELIPTRPAPYEPAREPLTPQRQAHNLRLLELALAQRPA
ncbi:WhiB family transcriptional regulator [Streptomyces mirabilis]|uniref:WhiB family transcriptional regulator n=1 Tax=Streptomyces mirabilis TaxID=68239 RepID=UPI0036C7599E